MNADQSRLEILFHRYTTGTCTSEEEREYLQLVKQEQHAPLLRQLILDRLVQTEPVAVRMDDAEAGNILKKITGSQSVANRVVFRQWLPWMAAAVVLLAVAAMVLFKWQKSSTVTPVVATNTGNIMPGVNKARLTLADGSVVELDSTGNQVLRQGEVTIQQQGGALQYKVESDRAAAIGSNLLSTPRGGQFTVTLPDGTRVWLNAESSIRYPVMFEEKERRVTVTGEAYFEVAANRDRPFRVDAGRGIAVQVLGTRFNINTYDNEPALTTTLLQGSVKVMQQAGGKTAAVLLHPGEQVLVQQTLGNNIPADTSRVMAWKNGLFNLDGVGVEELMRQLERWYNIKVEYEQQPPNIRLFGKISKNRTLDNFLKLLEYYEVKFKRQGNTLIVLPGA